MEYKSQEEYLLALAEELKYLQPKDATKVLQYYQTKISNAIDYGTPIEKVLSSLPDVEEVAKGAYESHGVKYLDIRKKQLKRKSIFDKIVNSILLTIIVFGFFTILFFLIKSYATTFTLFSKLIYLPNMLNKVLSILITILYILTVFFAFIYVIDLFYILITSFLSKIISFKDENLKRKVYGFTISGYLDEKFKTNKFLLKTIISIIVINICLMVASYTTKGYIYSTINDKASNSENIEVDSQTNNINIDAYDVNIAFKMTSDKESITHNYEFREGIKLDQKNDVLDIKVRKSEKYDIFSLLKEPTQTLIININKDNIYDTININANNASIDLTDAILNNIKINITGKTTTTIVNSNITSFSITGSNISLGVHNSKASKLEYESTSGQLVIEENSIINSLVIDNKQSGIKIVNSKFDDATITNSSGSINIDNINCDDFTMKSSTAKAYIYNSIFNKMNLEVSSTGLIGLDKIVAKEKVEAKCDASYITIDYLKTPSVNIDASKAAVLLNKIGSDIDTANKEYQDYKTTVNAKIVNLGSTSKTQITDSSINTLDLSQEEGYLIVQDTRLLNSKITCSRTAIVELINLDGELMDLYLSKISNYTKITSTSNPELQIKLHTDIISSSIVKEGKVNVEIVTNGEDNE